MFVAPESTRPVTDTELRQPEPDQWPSRSQRAMGCTMSIRIAAEAAVQPETVNAALTAAFDHIAKAEQRWTRFDPTSELCGLNAQPGRWITVSASLWGALTEALAQAEATHGCFDPTLLQAILSAGYTRSYELLDEQPALPRMATPPMSRTGQWRAVKLDPAKRRIKLPLGVGMDLGGIGKGLVAAQVVELLRPYGPTLVDAGGDIAAGAPAPGFPGWPVAIAAPTVDSDNNDSLTEEQDLLWVWLREATLATSGVDFRRWQRDGQQQHHIIDPRTGDSARTDLVTVSVLDRSATRAEAWAKAALVLGAEAAYVALTRRHLAALLVEHDGRVWMTPALRPWVAWQSPRVRT